MINSPGFSSDNLSYEMADKKGPSLEVSRVDSRDDEQPMIDQQSSLPTHPMWQTIEPDTLVEDPKWEILLDVYDSFLCAVSCVLLVKTSLVVYAWHKDRINRGYSLDLVSPLTLKLLEFNDQVVTAFTIIFVTIMTTATRRLALYKAQQGAYISDIEQLQASISLPSTLKMVFYLRKFTKFSAILVVFWSFFYLGSQASKREYAYVLSKPYSSLEAVYPSDKANSTFDPGQYTADKMHDFAPNSDFLTSLGFLTILPAGIDQFGYSLIPDPQVVGALKADGTVNSSNTFAIIPSQASYSAYVGLPLNVKVSTQSNKSEFYWSDIRIVGDYSLQKSILKAHCESVDVLPANQFPANVIETMSVSINMTSSNNTGNATEHKLELWRRWDSDWLAKYRDLYEPLQVPTVNGVKAGTIKISCSLVQPRVNVRVHCSEAACVVRELSCPYVDPLTLRNTRFSNPDFAVPFFSNMLLSAGVPDRLNETGFNAVESALSLDYDYIVPLANNDFNATVRKSSLESTSGTLSALINTYYNLAMRNYPASDEDATPANGFDAVPVHGAIYEPHYAIHWHWIAIDYFSGFLLLAVAVASFWFRKHTLAPDIFGYVSSLTRDNPQFPVPPGGSTLPGLDRTKALRNMKVKIGDVGGPKGEVGRVGFIPVQPNVHAGQLSRERKYL